MNLQKIQNLDLKNKQVLLRIDVNVPLSELGKIMDLSRIQATLETIRYLLEQNCSIVMMSHLGRPKGEKNLQYSLAPVHRAYQNLLDRRITFVEDIYGEEEEQMLQNLAPGQIAMLENVRFYD